MIEINGLEYSFGKLKALDLAGLSVGSGEIFGLIGPNGAGKSTLIQLLSTAIACKTGTIRVNGLDLKTHQDEIRHSLGVVFQDYSLDDKLTAEENLYFHARLYHYPRSRIAARIEEVLRLVGLAAWRHNLVSTFSGGMKRRLEIARAILHEPRLLLLDEPTVGLDPQTRSIIWDYLARLHDEEGLTVFLTTHYLEEAEICDRIAIIDRGRLIALDTAANLKRDLGGGILIVRAADPRAVLEYTRDNLRMPVRQVGNALRVCAPDPDQTLAALQAFFGQGIIGNDQSDPTLEDVFVRLTGHESRPEPAGGTDRLREIVKARRIC